MEDKRKHEKKRVWDTRVHFAAASPDLPGRAVPSANELVDHRVLREDVGEVANLAGVYTGFFFFLNRTFP